MSTPIREHFATSVAEAIATWSELAEWQRRAIMAISPELADRLARADAAVDALAETDPEDERYPQDAEATS